MRSARSLASINGVGRATVAITLDTYSHVVPGMGEQTAKAMEDVLS